MKLNPKRERFCQEFVVDHNATQAVISAGYAEKTATSQASRLLTKVNVQQRIADLQRDIRERTDVDIDQVIEALARVAFFDPQSLFDDDGKLIPVEQPPANVAKAVKVEITHNADGR